jgi:DNA-binding NtrC family response regulator
VQKHIVEILRPGYSAPTGLVQQLTADRYVMTHVPFADDDERVLRGIRRTMRSTHPDWEMSFGGDNEAALEHLDNAGADVIVSDTQMSGVDGLALLQPVRMRHPETARIMLTG